MAKWSLADMPSQAGRVAIVTGATGGLGYETAKALAASGATVVLSGRDTARGEAAVGRIRRRHPEAKIEFGLCDLADLASVRRFAARQGERHGRLDLLVANAGVMAVPTRRTTADGFELQFGTNYLGHFALAGLLLPALRRGRDPRLVTVASLAHKRGRIDFADPQGERTYGAWRAYSQSKLAMLMLAIEFQRRSAALGWGVMGVAAHPGLASTDIFRKGPSLDGGGFPIEWAAAPFFRFVGQSAAEGALPILYAATVPGVEAAGYYGPDGFMEFRGAPARAFVAPKARDVEAAAKLWALSVSLTGVDPEAVAAEPAPVLG